MRGVFISLALVLVAVSSVHAVISWNEFQRSLTVNGYAEAPYNYYEVIMRDACSRGGICTKLEMAMFLAQIYHESGGLVHRKELNPWPDYGYYYGRGFIQLVRLLKLSRCLGTAIRVGCFFFLKTWDYNYRAASRALYGDDRLLHNPDLVLADDVSWLVSFWYWNANVHNAPGVQQGQFGAATNAVNGALECRGAYQHTAKKRFEMYKRIFQVFGLSGSPNESGCYPVSGGGGNNGGGNNGGQYTIKPGDTFWLISQQFGTTVDAIMAANPGVSATSLWVGQVINLP